MKSLIFALIPLCLGLVCGAVRATIWAVTYDPATQLLTEPELLPLSHGLALVFLLISLLLFWKRYPKGTVPASPHESRGLPSRLVRLLASALAIGSGVMMLQDVLGGGNAAIIPLLMAVFQLAQGAAMLLLTLDRNPKSGRYSALLLVGAFCTCYWLVAFYHVYGSYPNVEMYLYPLLAGLAVMGSWIYYAGFAFGSGESRKFVVVCLLALILLPSALTAPISTAYALSLAAQLVWFFAACALLKPEPAVEIKENGKEEDTNV